MAAAGRKHVFAAFVHSTQRSSWSYLMLVRNYAKQIVSKVSAQSAQKTKLEVEKDPERLLKYCCGACIYVEGKDLEIKADSEYPDWLWSLRTERNRPDLSELDPNTAEYWKQLSRITRARNIRITKRLQKLKEIQYPEDKI